MMKNLPPERSPRDIASNDRSIGSGFQLAQEKHSVPPAVCDCDEIRPLITAWTCPVHGYIERRP